jgi:hypothetical protein
MYSVHDSRVSAMQQCNGDQMLRYAKLESCPAGHLTQGDT